MLRARGVRPTHNQVPGKPARINLPSTILYRRSVITGAGPAGGDPFSWLAQTFQDGAYNSGHPSILQKATREVINGAKQVFNPSQQTSPSPGPPLTQAAPKVRVWDPDCEPLLPQAQPPPATSVPPEHPPHQAPSSGNPFSFFSHKQAPPAAAPQPPGPSLPLQDPISMSLPTSQVSVVPQIDSVSAPLSAAVHDNFVQQAPDMSESVAAAQQLQAIIQQYKAQLGPGIDARVEAASAKLQRFIDSASQGTKGIMGPQQHGMPLHSGTAVDAAMADQASHLQGVVKAGQSMLQQAHLHAHGHAGPEAAAQQLKHLVAGMAVAGSNIGSSSSQLGQGQHQAVASGLQRFTEAAQSFLINKPPVLGAVSGQAQAAASSAGLQQFTDAAQSFLATQPPVAGVAAQTAAASAGLQQFTDAAQNLLATQPPVAGVAAQTAAASAELQQFTDAAQSFLARQPPAAGVAVQTAAAAAGLQQWMDGAKGAAVASASSTTTILSRALAGTGAGAGDQASAKLQQFIDTAGASVAQVQAEVAAGVPGSAQAQPAMQAASTSLQAFIDSNAQHFSELAVAKEVQQQQQQHALQGPSPALQQWLDTTQASLSAVQAGQAAPGSAGQAAGARLQQMLADGVLQPPVSAAADSASGAGVSLDVATASGQLQDFITNAQHTRLPSALQPAGMSSAGAQLQRVVGEVASSSKGVLNAVADRADGMRVSGGRLREFVESQQQGVQYGGTAAKQAALQEHVAQSSDQLHVWIDRAHVQLASHAPHAPSTVEGLGVPIHLPSSPTHPHHQQAGPAALLTWLQSLLRMPMRQAAAGFGSPPFAPALPSASTTTADTSASITTSPITSALDPAGSGSGSGFISAAQNPLQVVVESLQDLEGHLNQARQQFEIKDPMESAAMDQLLSQLSAMSDKLTTMASMGMTNLTAAAPWLQQGRQAGQPAGCHDQALHALDGLYRAMVVDSGLRGFMASIKHLGDSLAGSMETSWVGAPPITKLVAYMAAVAGMLMLMNRTRLSDFASMRGQQQQQQHKTAAGTTAPAKQQQQQQQQQARASSPPSSSGSSTAPLPLPVEGLPPLVALRKEREQSASTTTVKDGNTAASAASASLLPTALQQASSSRVGGQQASSSAAAAAVVDAEFTPSPSYSSPLPSHSAATTAAGSSTTMVPTTATATVSDASPAAPSPGPLGPAPENPNRSNKGPRNNVQLAWDAFRQDMKRAAVAAAAASQPVPPGVAAATTAGSDVPASVMQQAVMAVADGSSSGSGEVAVAVANVAATAVAAAVGSDEYKVAAVERAAEMKKVEKEHARLRGELKERLRWVTLGLGPVMAVVPGGEPVRQEVDRLVQQLEAVTPCDKPLNMQVDVQRLATVDEPRPSPQPLLLGAWQLVYASNGDHPATNPRGSNLVAQLLQLADSLPGFGMEAVMQRLRVDPERRGVILTENSAVFRFGPFGSWRVAVTGCWVDNGGGMCAQAWFEAFALRPISFLGLTLDTFPEIVVPVPEALQNQGEWCSTYVDEEARVGRGPQGNLFLFKKVASLKGAAASWPSLRRRRGQQGQGLGQQTSGAVFAPAMMANVGSGGQK